MENKNPLTEKRAKKAKRGRRMGRQDYLAKSDFLDVPSEIIVTSTYDET